MIVTFGTAGMTGGEVQPAITRKSTTPMSMKRIGLSLGMIPAMTFSDDKNNGMIHFL